MTVTSPERVRRLRKEMQWTQETLAAKAGISDRSVRRAEAGKRVETETWIALAHALGIKPNELLKADPATDIELIPIESGVEFFDALAGAHAFAVRADETTDEAAADLIKGLLAHIETAEMWPEIPLPHRYDAQREVAGILDALKLRGWSAAYIRRTSPRRLSGGQTIPNWTVCTLRVMDFSSLAMDAKRDPALMARLEAIAQTMGITSDELRQTLDDVAGSEDFSRRLSDAADELKLTPRHIQEALKAIAGSGPALRERLEETAQRFRVSPDDLSAVLDKLLTPFPRFVQ